MKLLTVLVYTDWGADKDTLLKLYRTLIRSKLNYGCFIYGAARPLYLKELNIIHHQGLRLALGAFKTSLVASLYTEVNKPQEIRQKNLLCNTVSNSHSIPQILHTHAHFTHNVQLYLTKIRIPLNYIVSKQRIYSLRCT